MKYCGHVFSDAEIEFIRNLTTEPGIKRTQISRRFCQEFGWRKPDGGLKDNTPVGKNFTGIIPSKNFDNNLYDKT